MRGRPVRVRVAWGGMFQIIGIVVIFASVFGGFLAAGGKIDVVLEAIPFEGTEIVGAAIGSFLLGNSLDTIKLAFGGIGGIFKGPKWKGSDYRDLLCCLYVLTRMMKTKGMIAVEQHIENPNESSIFKIFVDFTTTL